MIAKTAFSLIEGYVNMFFKRAGFERDQIRNDLFSIDFWSNGSNKEPVLFIHGLGLEAKYQWFMQCRAFSRKYRVIIPNLLGFGHSLSMKDQYSVDDQVEMILTLIDELQIKEVHLVGISYGGLVAAEFARNYPNRIRKLVLVDAVVKVLDESDLKRVLSEFECNELEELFIPSDTAGLKKLFIAATGNSLPVNNRLLVSFHKERILSQAPLRKAMIGHLLSDMQRFQDTHYAFYFPVCLIWGKDDLLIPSASADRLAEHLGGLTEVHVIEKAGHMPNITRPIIFNRILGRFLD